MNSYLHHINSIQIEHIGYLLAVAFILSSILVILRLLYGRYYLTRIHTTMLELTPSSYGDKTTEANNQLFLSLYGLGMSRKPLDRLLGRPTVFSLEIVSTRQTGIRYLIRCRQEHAATIERLIASHTPETKVKTVEDYINNTNVSVFEYRQKAHFAYPLKNHDLLSSSDPISYLTNAMTKLEENELMSVQLVVKPVQLKEAEQLRKKILINDALLPEMHKRRIKIQSIFTFINTMLFGIMDIFTSTYHTQSQSTMNNRLKELEYEKQIAKGLKPARTLSYFEQELVESISLKLSQTLFQTDVRVLIKSTDKQAITTRRKNFESALHLYAVPRYQQLRLRLFKHHSMKKYSTYSALYRLPSLLRSHSNIFAASELSSLYHFPNTKTAKTENIVKSLSKTLPAVLSLKGTQKLDVILGVNEHQGTSTPLSLTAAERERHVYVIGGTGNGKTTMLLYGIVQDIKAGKGIAVLDPHGDMAEAILRHIPEERIQDVIYLNPDDLDHPIGVNLLELRPGLTGNELLREKDQITESVVSVFRKIFSEDDSGGHRIEYVLRNTIQTALLLEDPTLFTIFRLLNDTNFRRNAIKQIDDLDLKNFWNNELGKAGSFQKVKMAAGITAKIGRFLFSASAKRILEQPHSTINFDDILNENKILICNFSKGLLGEDTSALFGTTILAKLQLSALRRARLQQTDRQPFYLYVDEFQNFATMGFVQMLSEARKYKLFLTMAEQSTSQQEEQRLVNIILANVGTVVCFRSGSPADEQFVLPLFSPYIQQGEIANLPSFSFYIRIAAIQAQEPMSGMTLLLTDDGSKAVAEQVIQSSQQLYALQKVVDTEPPKVNAIDTPSIKTEKIKKQQTRKVTKEVVSPPALAVMD